MARLLDWPLGLRANAMKRLAGPRTKGPDPTESGDGTIQTVTTPFGARSFELGFPNIRGAMARRVRGWISAQHGGANATRVQVCDWDGMTREQMGLSGSREEWRRGIAWSNGAPWSNGENWGACPPVVPVSAGASRGDTIVSLANKYWGYSLGLGDWLGFMPFHFGWYEVTEVIEPGTYRIDLPLRAALTTSSYATLRPVVAARMLSESAAEGDRNAVFLSGLRIRFTEVFDYDVRDYFTD